MIWTSAILNRVRHRTMDALCLLLLTPTLTVTECWTQMISARMIQDLFTTMDVLSQ